MDTLRNKFDNLYDTIKPLIFATTSNNPDIAHKIFTLGMQGIKGLNLENVILDTTANNNILPFEISNAAGLNKDAEIHPLILKALGFDRVNIGTVTNDKWAGNLGQTVWRFVESKSLVNNKGLPGIGSKAVGNRLISYGDHGVPLTVSIMSTPQKSGRDMLNDLRGTICDLKHVPFVDRFELNISCPNTHSCDGLDNRIQYMIQLHNMLDITDSLVDSKQELYVKLSSDATKEDIDTVFETIRNHKVAGFTVGNTTKTHNSSHIVNSPGVGGASGSAVYDLSFEVQQYVQQKIVESGRNYKIDACGGIDSFEKIDERTSSNLVTGIQLFTPFIFEGPKLTKNIRQHYGIRQC